MLPATSRNDDCLEPFRKRMLSLKSRLMLETGNCPVAYILAGNLLKNENQPPVVKISVLAVMATLKMRKGDPGALPLLLEANAKALETMELQRIIPALAASLEYEWITGETIPDNSSIDLATGMMEQSDNFFETNEFVCWLIKARSKPVPLENLYEGTISAQKRKRCMQLRGGNKKVAVMSRRLPYLKELIIIKENRSVLCRNWALPLSTKK